MDKLYCMKVFAVVYEQRSFVGASKLLGMSAPSVTRSIAHLEHLLKVNLFVRSTRHVKPTDIGAIYYQEVSQILSDIDMAEDIISGDQQRVTGQLHLTAPVMFGRLHIAPIIAEYMQQHPLVTVNAMFHDHVVNLMETPLEVAVRLGDLEDSNLYAVKVGHVRRLTCAAPSYLEKQGVPKSPESLNQHHIITASGTQGKVTWTFGKQGKTQKVQLQPRLVCNQIDMALDIAKRGGGVMQRMSYQVIKEIEQGELVPLLESFEPPAVPVHIVHLEGKRASTKTRAFIDLAVERLKQNPAIF